MKILMNLLIEMRKVNYILLSYFFMINNSRVFYLILCFPPPFWGLQFSYKEFYMIMKTIKIL